MILVDGLVTLKRVIFASRNLEQASKELESLTGVIKNGSVN